MAIYRLLCIPFSPGKSKQSDCVGMYMHGLVCQGYGHMFPSVALLAWFVDAPWLYISLVVLQLTDEKYPNTPLHPQFTLVLTQVETVLETFQKISVLKLFPNNVLTIHIYHFQPKS